MRQLLRENIIPALWIAFALYWVLAAVRQKRAKQDESLLVRLFYLVLVVIAFLFLLDKKDSIAALWILLGLYATFAILRIRGAKQRQSLFTHLPHVCDDRRVRCPPRKAGAFRPLRPEIPSRFTNLDLDWRRPDGVRNRAGHLGAFLPWGKLERHDHNPRWSFAR